MPPGIWLIAVLLALLSLGRIVLRSAPKGTDWPLEVAFIRLDFPAEQRRIAQQLAAGLAEIVGMKIKQLKPEHNLAEIATWADDVYARDLITLFVVAFNVTCDERTTFRNLVEQVAQKKIATGVSAA